MIWFDDDGQGAVGLNLIFLSLGLTILLMMRNRISQASVQETMLRARTMGTRVADGGKKRVVD
jgi:CRP-like cAMP-binding protein